MHERFILKVDHGRILTLCPIIDIYVGWKSWLVAESIVHSSQVVDVLLLSLEKWLNVVYMTGWQN